MHEYVVDPADVPWIEPFPDGSKAFFDFFVFQRMFVLLDEIRSYERNWKHNNESSKHDDMVDVFYRYVSCHVSPLEESIEHDF